MGFRIEKGFTSPPPATPPEQPNAELNEKVARLETKINEQQEIIDTLLGVTE